MPEIELNKPELRWLQDVEKAQILARQESAAFVMGIFEARQIVMPENVNPRINKLDDGRVVMSWEDASAEAIEPSTSTDTTSAEIADESE